MKSEAMTGETEADATTDVNAPISSFEENNENVNRKSVAFVCYAEWPFCWKCDADSMSSGDRQLVKLVWNQIDNAEFHITKKR